MKTYKITAILVVLFFLLANSKITSAQIAPGGTGEVTIIKTTSATITSVYVGSAVGSNAMYIASNSSGTYSKSGTRLTIRFNVTLTNDAPSGQTLSVNFMVLIISSGGMSNLPEAVSITVAKPSTPAAGFSGTPTSGTAPLSVQFTDQSTGDIASRLWDFGDGGTSTVQNPQHTYSSAGIFTVKLKVTNATGLDEKIRTNYITVVVPSIAVKIPLRAGWNLISWNVDTANDSAMALVKNIVSNVIVVLGYEGGGQTYDPKLPNLSTLTIMDHLHGYWLKMADDDTLRLLGTFVDYNTTFIACQAGWNLVSYLPDKPDSVSHCFSSVMKDNLITALAYNGAGLTYSPALPSFSTLKVASPFLGYWLKLEQAADLLYPTPLIEYNQVINSWPALTKSISGMLPQSQSEVLLPTIEWMNLYGENLMYRGTLLAPGTVITARTEGGNICGAFTVHQAGMFGLMPVYRDDPSTDVREGPQASESFYLYFDGEKISVVLRWSSLGDAVRLAGTVTAIEDDNASLPLTSELSQNYPNPFNPQTTIAYQLHKSGFVNISVCNMLGQEVALLVCEIKPAGMHHVIWDGRDKIGTHLPSGIYYCRMTTPGFSQTQKMVILY